MTNAVTPAEVKTADVTLIAIPAFTPWLSPVEGELGVGSVVEVRVLDAEGSTVADDDDDDDDGDDDGDDDVDDDVDDDGDGDGDGNDSGDGGDKVGDIIGETVRDAVEVVCGIFRMAKQVVFSDIEKSFFGQIVPSEQIVVFKV
ncbi:MAG: hypothetical protein LQ342_004608 [Letrouitia transgressa]|nr:MAG: hypothetical protein LQ342_004608 [Letrouitia transgressa]